MNTPRSSRMPMSLWCGLFLALGTGLSVTVPAASADAQAGASSISEEALAEAGELFERLYGDQVRRLRTSRDTREAVEMAQRLYTAARSDDVDAALATHLLESAHDLGARHRSGYELAVEAMQRLGQVVPSRRPESLNRAIALARRAYAGADGQARRHWAQNLIEMHLELAQMQFDAGELTTASRTVAQASPFTSAAGRAHGEDVRVLQRRIEDLMRLNRQVETLRSRLEQNPNDEELATRLALMLLLDLDDPTAAREAVEGVEAESLLQYMELAGRDAYELEPDEAWRLAHWFMEQADTRRGDTAARLLARADEALETLLGHSAAEIEASRRTEARLLRQKLDGEIRKMAAEGVAAAVGEVSRRTVNLLEHMGRPRSSAEGDTMHLHDGRLRVEVPETGPWHFGPWFQVTAGFRYELQSRVLVSRGGRRHGIFQFYFPVGETRLRLQVPTGGRPESGRALVSDGRPPKVYGFTAGPGQDLERDQEIKIRIVVHQVGSNVEIRIDLDDQQRIAWQGTVHDLAPPPRDAMGHPQQFRMAFPPSFLGSVRELTVSGDVQTLPEDTARLP